MPRIDEGTLLADLDAVVQALGGNVALLGSGAHSSFVAALWASAHPERVIALLLTGAYRSGTAFLEDTGLADLRPLLTQNPELYASALVRTIQPADDPAAVQRMVDGFFEAATPEIVRRYCDAMDAIDLTSVLPTLSSPTSVVQMEGLPANSAGAGQDVARAIPGAQFETIEVKDWFSDEARRDRAEPMARLLAAQRPLAEPASGSFRTILFTDVVGSTPLLAQLKDAKMREIMRDHDALLQAAVDAHGGRTVKEIGDGFMVDFPLPSAAVECAIAMQHTINAKFADTDVPIRLRIGINAGEPIVEDDDLDGASVVIAKRLESAAPANGILIADGVKQLLAGKDFDFHDQGEIPLQGFDDSVRAWAVGWSA